MTYNALKIVRSLSNAVMGYFGLQRWASSAQWRADKGLLVVNSVFRMWAVRLSMVDTLKGINCNWQGADGYEWRNCWELTYGWKRRANEDHVYTCQIIVRFQWRAWEVLYGRTNVSEGTTCHQKVCGSAFMMVLGFIRETASGPSGRD